MASGPDTGKHTAPVKKGKRRYVISLGIYLAGIATGIYIDTKPYINRLWKSTVNEAVDSGQWLRIGGCTGVNKEKKKVEIKVYRYVFGVGPTRKIVVDQFIPGYDEPIRTAYSATTWLESNPKFEARILKMVYEGCGVNAPKL